MKRITSSERRKPSSASCWRALFSAAFLPAGDSIDQVNVSITTSTSTFPSNKAESGPADVAGTTRSSVGLQSTTPGFSAGTTLSSVGLQSTTPGFSAGSVALECIASLNVRMTVENLGFSSLQANEVLRARFEAQVKGAIAAEVGVSPDRMVLDLAAGSVLVTATLQPLRQAVAEQLRAQLGASATLSQRVALSVQAIQGLEALSTGPIGVTNVRATSTPLAHAPIELTVIGNAPLPAWISVSATMALALCCVLLTSSCCRLVGSGTCEVSSGLLGSYELVERGRPRTPRTWVGPASGGADATHGPG